MIGYPKIDTLFNRDPKFKVIEGDFKNPVIPTISQWIATEKVDGTNIRVDFRRPEVIAPVDIRHGVPEYPDVTIGGRTDKADTPKDLLAYLTDLAERNRGLMIAKMNTHKVDSVTLFGEGYGAGIQSGGRYRKDKGFILFDVLVNDEWWLEWGEVVNYAALLSIPHVPYLGIMTMDEMITKVKAGMKSRCSVEENDSEGIVARPLTTLYDNRKKRIIVKIKTRDFR